MRALQPKYSPANLLARFLVGAGQVSLGSVRGVDSAPAAWPAFTGRIPSVANGVPINAVGFIDTTPVKDGRLMSGQNVYHPGVQILLRAQTYPIGWEKIVLIHDQLEAVSKETITTQEQSFTLWNVSVASGPVYIGLDPDSQNELFSLNVLLTLT